MRGDLATAFNDLFPNYDAQPQYPVRSKRDRRAFAHEKISRSSRIKRKVYSLNGWKSSHSGVLLGSSSQAP